jgi:hypothetical protein
MILQIKPGMGRYEARAPRVRANGEEFGGAASRRVGSGTNMHQPTVTLCLFEESHGDTSESRVVTVLAPAMQASG